MRSANRGRRCFQSVLIVCQWLTEKWLLSAATLKRSSEYTRSRVFVCDYAHMKVSTDNLSIISVILLY